MAKIKYDKAKEVISQASMQEKPKAKKKGRPTKDVEGATQKIMLNVTPTQKQKIQDYVDEHNLSIAGLIKGLLKEKKIF